jgi:hypothetical protein
MTRLVISRSDNLSLYEEINTVNFSAWIQPESLMSQGTQK